jgi:DNA topoisomerase-2
MEKRVYEIAGCNVNLTIYFNGKRIVMKSFKDYCQMYINEGDLLLYEENKDWQVGLSVSPTGSFQQVSYVNCVNTFDGGTHNDHILNQIIPSLREKISKKFKTDILPGQIKNHMFLFINSTVINPAFSSQTKEKLITDIKNFGTEIKLTDKFINSIYKSEITNSITDWLDQKKVADEKKAEREANKAIAKVKVDKLIDCKWAGTDKKDKCRLILTEGDSALCSLRKFRNVETDSGLPLRGKSLNVRDLPKSKVMDNAEIMAVMAAMGLKFGESPITFDNKGNIVEDKTRFGQIHIYTDADVDGTACAALILNYIHKFWPDLIRAHKIARAETPIIIAEHKKTKKEKWFYYDSEYKDWCSGKDLKDYDIHYMKGLGALNDKQSKEIFQNPHLYYYELDDFAEDSMQIWFGKDSEMRKKKLV